MKHSAGSVRALWDDTLSGYPPDWTVPPGVPPTYSAQSSIPDHLGCWVRKDAGTIAGPFCDQPPLDKALGLCKDHYDELKEASR